ncbi:MAG: hypothetical protein NTX01_03125 [Candidatus Omnitrophica bacterium]|nr:hypothetical protein [Candidatus Omnitrophota bacterium]
MKSNNHKEAQKTIQDYYISIGWIAIIEHYIRGKKIDVLAQNIKTKRTIANEIQLTSRHFLENIQLDIKAGCDEVITICLDNSTLEEIKRKAQTGLDKNLLGKTRFQHIEEFIPHSRNNNNTK